MTDLGAVGQTTGRLIVVGTPIGNLGDLSPRAAETLATVDAIACEDTRRTGRLLKLSGLAKKPLLVANAHTEASRAEEIVRRVAEGERVALVSDAGMPLVSDPGERIVSAVLAAGLSVGVVPGPTALVSALALSGLSTERFVFEGFLARKGSDRQNQLLALAAEPRTIVIYESPKRLERTLVDLSATLGGDRRAATVREITKLYESVERGSLAELVERAGAKEQRGEFVIVVEGASDTEPSLSDDELLTRINVELAAGRSRRDIVADLTALSGRPKRHIYDLANQAGDSGPPQDS